MKFVNPPCERLKRAAELCVTASAFRHSAKMSQGSYAILLGIGISTCVLFSSSLVLFFRERTVWSLLQLFGAGCLLVVLLTHVFERFTCSPGCIGDSGIALAITSISGAPSLVSRYFLRDICSMRLQGGEPSPFFGCFGHCGFIVTRQLLMDVRRPRANTIGVSRVDPAGS